MAPTATSVPQATASAPTTLPATATTVGKPTAAVRLRQDPTTAPASPTTAETEPNTPTEAATPESSTEDDVAEIRRIVEAYWIALNEYDVDHAITMLEPGYRALEEELIRSDIGRMKLFRVKLGVSEETPPALNADGDYETFLNLKTPVDTRRVLMVFRRIGGQWWIVFSDEVE